LCAGTLLSGSSHAYFLRKEPRIFLEQGNLFQPKSLLERRPSSCFLLCFFLGLSLKVSFGILFSPDALSSLYSSSHPKPCSARNRPLLVENYLIVRGGYPFFDPERHMFLLFRGEVADFLFDRPLQLLLVLPLTPGIIEGNSSILMAGFALVF